MRAEQEIIANWKTSDVLLSICCTAYNQEAYISRAIESFLVQETNFPYEIIISDDCSTDKTTEIIKSYVVKYPKIIKHICHNKNKYSKGVIPIRDYILPMVESRYIALCEGDDFWVDTYKLQKQVDLLESQPFLSGVGHNTELMENGKLSGKFIPNFKNREKEFVFDDFIDFNHYMHTSSLVYRYNASHRLEIDNYFSKYPSIDFNDTFMLLVFARFGSIGYIDEVMSVYRITDAGLWMGLDKQNQSVIFLKACLSFRYIFDDKYAEFFLEHFVSAIFHCSKEDDSFDLISKLLQDFNKNDCEKIICDLLYLTKLDKKNISSMADALKNNSNLIHEQKEYIEQLEELKSRVENNKCYLVGHKISSFFRVIANKCCCKR